MQQENPVEIIACEVASQQPLDFLSKAHNDGTLLSEKQALRAFFFKWRKSPNTLRRYKTELARLWIWAEREGKLISQLSPEDYERYEDFLRDPQPRSTWCMAKRFPRHDPNWRPFTGPLSTSSVKHAFSAVSALITTWVRAGYLNRDPLAFRSKIKDHMSDVRTTMLREGQNGPLLASDGRVASVDKWFDKEMREAIHEALDAMPSDTLPQCFKRHQYRLVIGLLQKSGCRISELENGFQGNFIERRTGWWLRVTGKGGEERDIPVPDDFIDQTLVPWRIFNKLPALPESGEVTPLLPARKHKPGKSGIRTRMALNIVKEVATMAIDFLPEHSRRAARCLAKASNHWFRHTFATALIDDDVPVKTILATMGQKSETTLRIYDHKSDDQRYDAVTRTSTNL